jgi:drug/metabolite transporter (DMT)-like permease
MILWIAGYKYNDATVTAVLNQTATLFTVLFAALFLKEKLTTKILFATGIAVAGVLLMILA